MPISPPKCKVCQKVEWRHICAGIPAARERVKEIEARPVTPSAKGAAKRAKKIGKKKGKEKS